MSTTMVVKCEAILIAVAVLCRTPFRVRCVLLLLHMLVQMLIVDFVVVVMQAAVVEVAARRRRLRVAATRSCNCIVAAETAAALVPLTQEQE